MDDDDWRYWNVNMKEKYPNVPESMKKLILNNNLYAEQATKKQTIIRVKSGHRDRLEND